MPVSYGQGASNTLTLGRDGSNIVLSGPFGSVKLVNVTGFDVKQDTQDITSNMLSGTRMKVHEPMGWSGSFDVDRGSNDLDLEFSKIERAWNANSNASLYSMTHFVVEATGSTTTMQYTNVTIKLSDAGNYKPGSTVKQKVEFWAYQRNLS